MGELLLLLPLLQPLHAERARERNVIEVARLPDVGNNLIARHKEPTSVPWPIPPPARQVVHVGKAQSCSRQRGVAAVTRVKTAAALAQNNHNLQHKSCTGGEGGGRGGPHSLALQRRAGGGGEGA